MTLRGISRERDASCPTDEGDMRPKDRTTMRAAARLAGLSARLTVPPSSCRRQNGFRQIAKLLGGVLVAFDVGRQAPRAIDYNSMQGMRECSLILPETHTKHRAHALNVRQRAC